MHFTARAMDRTAEGLADLVWEETDCPLCGGTRWSPVLEAADPLPGPDGLRFLVVRCRDCGLSYTNPRPATHSISAFYPDNYVCHRPRRAAMDSRADAMARLLPVQGLARLLDFGCGNGEFLRSMHARGWTVTGVDTSESAVERVRNELKVNVLAGSLPRPDLRERSFEAVTMWQALEHVHRPLEVLRAVYDLLVPGGRLVVAVPNIESHNYRWFGPSWYALDLPRHLTHFSPGTLRGMMQAAGFHVDRIRMVRHPGWLRHSARLHARTGGSKLLARLLTTRFLSGALAWYSYLSAQSDCILGIAIKA